MEYFNPEEVDGLSLQDMIDCDIKTDIDNLLQMQNSEKLSSLEYCLQQISNCDVGAIQNNNNLEYIPMGGLDMAMEAKNSWGTSEAARLHQLGEAENTDPNLLVNPQTGMPVHEQMETETNTHLPRLVPSLNGNTQEIVGILTTSQQQLIPVTLNSLQTSAGTSPLRLTTITGGLAAGGQARQSHVEVGLSSPSQTNPVLLEQLQNPIGANSPRKLQCVTNTQLSNFCMANGNGNLSVRRGSPQPETERIFSKPAYSYSCLIAMALKNSKTGSLPVSEIYSFMTSNFPYFKTAPDGWKNSVRHNLSLNKCFEKVENPNSTGTTRKGCLWGLNPAKVGKMEEEIVKWRKKDPESVKNSLANPENLELIESGRAGSPPTPQRRGSQTSDHDVSEAPIINGSQVTHLLLASDGVKQKGVGEMLNVDLSGLDSSLSLDPVLSELASQSGLWDDDLTSELKLDVPFSSSPLTTCNSPLLSQPTPLTGFTTCDTSSIQGSYVYTTAPFHLVEQSPGSKQITIYSQTPTRTLSAQT